MLKYLALLFILLLSLAICPAARAEEDTQWSDLHYEAWQLIHDNSLFQNKLKDWSYWQNRYKTIESEASLSLAVKAMLEEIGDEYSAFRSVAETEQQDLRDDEHDIVTLRLLPSKEALIKIRTFSSEHTAEELKAALEQATSASSYIIDLRDNRGGLVTQAFLCFALLVDHGQFVKMAGRQDGKNYCERLFVETRNMVRKKNNSYCKESRNLNLTNNKPLLVLINQDSKSAAEMLAGALKDVRGATLAGSKSFGKGVVQNTWHLGPGCSLKIAVAKFYLPSGKWIHGCGIEPDIQAAFSEYDSPSQASEIHICRDSRQK
ncbi:MAG: S41 family peptidase [Candidatus Obscuribacterales bacterium]|nr:S41 family peptidase [Candidatus Obscuribacterales bacterium]